MANPKSKGGPKTIVGKAKVAQNALKHGLSTMSPSSIDERQMVDQFSQELIHFYQPKNPLAILQIQRIAMCRAKLARLYQVEHVRLQIVHEELKQTPEKILEKLVGVEGVPKGMLLELVRSGQVTLPCGLVPVTLKKICQEIDGFYGAITSEKNLRQFFPALEQYLHSHVVRGLAQDATLFDKLLAVIARIEEVFKEGEQYHEKYRSLIEGLLDLKNQSKAKEPTDPEIEELVGRVKVVGQKRNPLTKNIEEPAQKPIPSSSELLKKLPVFLQLLRYYEQVLLAREQYEKIKTLMLQSATLPTSEADVLMRYQTTLERRLSAAMGELLALEKQGSL
jgi:hypothetical protein